MEVIVITGQDISIIQCVTRGAKGWESSNNFPWEFKLRNFGNILNRELSLGIMEIYGKLVNEMMISVYCILNIFSSAICKLNIYTKTYLSYHNIIKFLHFMSSMGSNVWLQ